MRPSSPSPGVRPSKEKKSLANTHGDAEAGRGRPNLKDAEAGRGRPNLKDAEAGRERPNLKDAEAGSGRPNLKDAEAGRGRPNLKPPHSPPSRNSSTSRSSSWSVRGESVRGESVSASPRHTHASPCTKPQPWGHPPISPGGGGDVWGGQEEDLSVSTENIVVVVRTRPLNEAERARPSGDQVVLMRC